MLSVFYSVKVVYHVCDLLHDLGRLGTFDVDHASLELIKDPSASAFSSAELKACTAMASLPCLFWVFVLSV